METSDLQPHWKRQERQTELACWALSVKILMKQQAMLKYYLVACIYALFWVEEASGMQYCVSYSAELDQFVDFPLLCLVVDRSGSQWIFVAQK